MVSLTTRTVVRCVYSSTDKRLRQRFFGSLFRYPEFIEKSEINGQGICMFSSGNLPGVYFYLPNN